MTRQLPTNKRYHYFIAYRCPSTKTEGAICGRCQIDRDAPICDIEDIYGIEEILGKKWKQEVFILNWRRFEDAE